MIYIAIFDDGKASIKNDDGEWWCGEREWVHPNSSYWDLCGDCWNHQFDSAAKAIAFAQKKGWCP